MSLYKGSNKIMNGIENVPIASTINDSSTNEECAGAKAVYDIVPTDTHIKEISLLGEPVADTTKYGDDLLYFPCGVYRITSDTFAKTLKNIPPSKKSGVFYITSIVPVGDLATQPWVYRSYRYEDYAGNIYVRSVSTGSTASEITDTGWRMLCKTNVADVQTTTITSYTDSAISTGILTYRVMNGICYVEVSGINVANAGIVYTIYDSMPKCAFIQRTNTTDANCTYNGGLVIPTNSTTLKVQVTTAGTIYGSFSYPVATA